MTEDIANATIENNNVVIRIPIDTLIFAQERNPGFHEVKIVDKPKFANEVTKRFIEFDEDQDTGLSRFYQMLDDITEEIAEEGNDCIRVKFSPDELEEN